MALSRRNNNRFAASIWPGFVDAMTALVLVLFFVLSIFMIVQFILRDTISGKDRELDELSVEVLSLADELGLARVAADQQAELIATVTTERDDALGAIEGYEAQVASLIARSSRLSDDLAATAQARDAAQARNDSLQDANSALETALASARDEMDAQAEAARLNAAKREAMEAVVASLRGDVAVLEGDLSSLQAEAEANATALTEAEKSRIAEAAAAAALRKRLQSADAELTAMTLNLEAERKKAEETLTLLAAAEAARAEIEDQGTTALSEAEKRQAELLQARALLAEQEEISVEAQKQVALLNQQTAELRAQLDSLQGLLDDSLARDIASKVQIEQLGANLNAALAQLAAEERARAEREKARADAALSENEQLGSDAKELARYRSEFFGRMRQILGDREGVRVVGDRFVFDSEVLFDPGSARLGAEGQAQIARVAEVIKDISEDIPKGIDWILRVDGHTDAIPVGSNRAFRDNWELSQARALSVVKFLIDAEGLPPDRLAATGFGEFQPVDTGDTPEALARNRRIELKFTER